MVALGDTVEEAFYKVFHLQAACEVQVCKVLWEVSSGASFDGSLRTVSPAGCQLGSCEPNFVTLPVTTFLTFFQFPVYKGIHILEKSITASD